jgi:transcriptional regulator with XRE-family HTH domain
MRALMRSTAKAGELFGQRLREVRQERQLTQLAVSERAGLLQNHISDFERGLRTPTLMTMIRLAIALDCKVSDLTEVFDDADLTALVDH